MTKVQNEVNYFYERWFLWRMNCTKHPILGEGQGVGPKWKLKETLRKG